MKIYIRFGLMAFWVLALTSLNLLFAQERIPFTNYEGVELEARIDEITGTATQIYGIRESVELYSLSRAQLDSSSIVQLGADMIRSYSEQLGISSRDMQVRNISTDGSWWFAEYKQQVRGIPVKYSEIGFTIDPEGYIVTLGAYAFPDIKDVPSPQLSADDAVRIAQRQFGVENPEAIHEPKLKILPIIEQSDYSWSLTWEIRIFSLQPVKDITYVVV